MRVPNRRWMYAICTSKVSSKQGPGRGARRHGCPAVSSDHDRLVDALATTVAVAPTVPDACQAAVAAVAERLTGTVACLLAVAGRLRCFGAAGAWQVFDGVPADAG